MATRRTLHLGAIPKKDAQAIKLRVEELLAGQIANTAPGRDLSARLAAIGDTLHERLARVGLVEQRERARDLTISALIDEFIAQQPDAKPTSIIRFRQLGDHLVRLLRDRPVRAIKFEDADDWRTSMRKEFAAATTNRRVRLCRQVWG